MNHTHWKWKYCAKIIFFFFAFHSVRNHAIFSFVWATFPKSSIAKEKNHLKWILLKNVCRAKRKPNISNQENSRLTSSTVSFKCGSYFERTHNFLHFCFLPKLCDNFNWIIYQFSGPVQHVLCFPSNKLAWTFDFLSHDFYLKTPKN